MRPPARRLGEALLPNRARHREGDARLASDCDESSHGLHMTRLITTVRAEGLEPPRSFEHGHLKTARLPFRHARSTPIVPGVTVHEPVGGCYPACAQGVLKTVST